MATSSEVLHSRTSWCFEKEVVPEDIESRARAAVNRVGVGISSLVDRTEHNGCLHCLRAQHVKPSDETVALWAPLLPCDRHAGISRWIRVLQKSALVIAVCESLLAVWAVEAATDFILPTVTTTIFFIGVWCLIQRWIERYQRQAAWGVIHVHQDFFKKCQVMATRMQAAPVKTLYAETLGTHGKFLDDLGCECKYVDTQQAVAHMITAAIASSAPSLVRPAEPKIFRSVSLVVEPEEEETTAPSPPLDTRRAVNVERYLIPAQNSRAVPPAPPGPPPSLPDVPPPAPPPAPPAAPPSVGDRRAEPVQFTDYLPDGTGIMGYMCPDQDLEGVAKDVKFGELLEKAPATKTAQIAEKEALIERLHVITEAQGVIFASDVMKDEKIQPQARICGPVLPDDLPKIAGPHSTCEKRAVAQRHFTEDPIAGKVQPHMIDDIREHVEMFVDFVKTGMQVTPEAFEMHGKRHAKTSAANVADMTYIDWSEMMSKSWKKEDGWKILEKVFTECVWVEGAKAPRGKAELRKLRSLKRSFFVKLNEALAKVKPRLIQQAGKEGAAIHIADAGILERIIFGIAFLEMRSIKHATPKQLRKRFASFLHRFFSGYAMSGDFGKYDSCMKSQIRKEVENTVVWELLGAFNPGSGVADRALADRLKEQLNSMSSHHWLSTCNAGRESGDRGTSLLNYITNLIIFTVTVAKEVQHREALAGVSTHDARLRGIQAIRKWYQGEPVGFDWVGEGDDNLHLYSKAYVHSAPGKDLAEKRLGIATRIVSVAKDLGFYLEPQGVEGEAPLEEALVPVTKRVEFTSKIMVPFQPTKGQLFVSFLPKVKKTLIGSQVTFCTDDKIGHATACFMKYLGMMHACIDAPPLFEYAAMFARHYARLGGGISLEALSSYDSQRLCESYGEDSATWLTKLRDLHAQSLNADGQTTAMQRAIEGEAPRLTGPLQEAAVLCMREENGTFDECCLTAKAALLQYIF